MSRSSLRKPGALLLVLLVLLASCRDSSEPVVPGTLQVVAGDGQLAAAGTPVGVAPAVQLLDTRGKPMRGVTVQFSASGTGTVTPATVTTNAQGIAAITSWTLPRQVGSHQLTATTKGVLPAVFTATAQPGPPVRIVIITQPWTAQAAGQPLGSQPVVEIRDQFDNRVTSATNEVTASTLSGAQTLSGQVTVAAVDGRATFTDLTVNGAGTTQLRFASGSLASATSAAFLVPATALCANDATALDFALGESRRRLMNASDAPACFDFLQSIGSGQEYLLLVENVSLSGSSDTGLFPGVASGLHFVVTAHSGAPDGAAPSAQQRVTAAPPKAVHAWDFGAGPIYEIEPPEPPGGVPPVLMQRGNVHMQANTVTAAVGDTILVRMEGIPRLGITTGNYQAVIRFANADIIIAEDLRLGTLTRSGGAANQPIPASELAAIAADYAQYAKVQGDLFFLNRHNAATEASGGTPIAIHSLMSSDNVWGYTYSSGNYFVWDYWVGTNGSTPGPNQRAERVANNLFMHEIAHMRHWGMNERAGRAGLRGNRWLVEGFARATERWPITMRLTGVTDFSRTGNIQLPLFNPTNISSLEDVPAYTAASQQLYAGYGSSSYVFDYFADQVAVAGGDWRTALGDFLVNAGVEADLNAAIARHLPDVDVGTLFTRARAALFLDDYLAGLPAWTQYHQFNLRTSRMTANPALDPRNAWPRIRPGAAFTYSQELLPGAAFGFVVDGTTSTDDARVVLQFPSVQHGVLSVTRIR